MAGILANSASVTMVSGTPDGINGGYVANETITLSTEPTGTAYEWSLAKPQGSTARANLSATTGTGITFTPDTRGVWTISCIVDGVTVYILRVGVEAVAITTHGDASHYIPIANASVPTPALGATLFFSRDSGVMSFKLADGSVVAIDTTP
jgi:hypothetical protein